MPVKTPVALSIAVMVLLLDIASFVLLGHLFLFHVYLSMYHSLVLPLEFSCLEADSALGIPARSEFIEKGQTTGKRDQMKASKSSKELNSCSEVHRKHRRH